MNRDLVDQDLAEVPVQENTPQPGRAPSKLGAGELAQRLSEYALLLDIDGTLLDLAPTPREVWVPPDLAETLSRLRDKTSGALALVSGQVAERYRSDLCPRAISGRRRPRRGNAHLHR